MADHDIISPFCPFYQHAVELLGRRWTGAIVRALLSGETRFVDLAHAIPGVSDRLLSERLKELEKEGLVVRTVTPSTPVRVDYHLTDKGRALAGVVSAISGWAHTWLSDSDLSATAGGPYPAADGQVVAGGR